MKDLILLHQIAVSRIAYESFTWYFRQMVFVQSNLIFLEYLNSEPKYIF
jgi:hypothetical protein